MSSLFGGSGPSKSDLARQRRLQKQQMRLAKSQERRINQEEAKQRQIEGARKRALFGRTSRGQGETLYGSQLGVPSETKLGATSNA
jgi:hypothetical protein